MTTTPPPDIPVAPSASHEDLHDRIVRAHGWVLDHWPTSLRRRIAIVVVLVAVGVVLLSALARLVGAAIDLGLLAYLGLMAVCWVGAGGALVPVPGTRPLSWVMIVQQSTSSHDPVVVALLGAFAMALGQTSYFFATRAGEHRVAGHHRGGEHRIEKSPKEAGRLVAWSRAVLERAKAGVSRLMHTHPQSTIFLLSVVPNPLTTFATVTASAAGVEFVRFFAASLAGFLVLTTALAVLGQGLLIALGVSG
jgi:membrane protein DedA with SNARE-associated domain